MDTHFLSHLMYLAPTLTDPDKDSSSRCQRIITRIETVEPLRFGTKYRLAPVPGPHVVSFENVVTRNQDGAIKKYWSVFGVVLIDITGDPRDDYLGDGALAPVLGRR